MSNRGQHHRRFSNGFDTQEKSHPPTRAWLGLGHFLLIATVLITLLALSQSAKAEDFHLIWVDSFCTETNWNVGGDQFIDPTPPCTLWQTANIQSFAGPTYRTLGTSTWNDATDPVVLVQVSQLAPHQDNTDPQQFVLRFSAGHSNADLGGAGSGEMDYFEARLIRTESPHLMRWQVAVKDDGVTAFFNHSISDTTDLDMYANLTINTVAQRYWINWSAGAYSGNETAAWTAVVDGPFAESNAQHLNLWSYTYSGSCFCTQWRLEALALYGANLSAPPSSAPPPTQERKPHAVAPNFFWVQTLLGTQFFDSSEGQENIAGWSWFFGDNKTSTERNPFHIYACNGTYEVTMTLTETTGRQAQVQAMVSIESDRLTCNILDRDEHGVTVKAFGSQLTLSTSILLLILILSAASLLGDSRGNTKPLVSRKLRWALLFISLTMLLLTSGVIGALVVGGRFS